MTTSVSHLHTKFGISNVAEESSQVWLPSSHQKAVPVLQYTKESFHYSIIDGEIHYSVIDGETSC